MAIVTNIGLYVLNVFVILSKNTVSPPLSLSARFFINRAEKTIVSDTKPSLNDILGKEGVQNIFNNLMSLWVLPEIEERKRNGRIPENFILDRAQVILPPDQQRAVRLNKEVSAFLKAKAKPGMKKAYNEPVYEHEIDGILDISLTDHDDPNAGHVTFLQFKNQWIIHMDFRQNRGKAKERYDSALQFFEAAKLCFKNRLERPFIDNLFSAAELLATSQLLCISGSKYAKTQSHASTNMKYNSYIEIGNAKREFANTLNNLWPLSDTAWYCNSQLKFAWQEGEQYLQAIEEMIEHTCKFIT
jgi:hypothetical protein